MRRGRIRRGEVVEIETPAGLLYAQAVAEKSEYGPLFQVPARIFHQRPERLPTNPSFPIFSPLDVAATMDFPNVRVRRLEIAPIPEEWQPFPAFRERTLNADLQEIWCIWDGSDRRPANSVSLEEFATYPERQAGPVYWLVRLAFDAAGVHISSSDLRRWFGIPDDRSDKAAIAHYLVFESEQAARAAAKELADLGTVLVDSVDDRWVATIKEDSSGAGNAIDDALEDVATRYGGVYDGRDTPV
jgi:Regulator of ribonuclease activity B